MAVLKDSLATQLRGLLANLREPIELAASLDDSAKSTELKGLLGEIAEMSDLITVTEESNERTPSFAIRRTGTDVQVRFAGVPLGHEFSSLVLALLQVSGHPPKLSDAQIEAIKALPSEREFVTYMSLTCTNCPDVVQAFNTISIVNPKIRHTAVEGGAFQDEVNDRGVMSVPATYENGELFTSGRASIDDVIAMLDDAASEREAAALSEEDPFDVLVIGGGPAASTASIYAARKELRTGMLCDRRGGQVLDTMTIENHISQKQTTGPKLAEDLTSHIGEYNVNVFTPQRAAQLIPAAAEGGLHTVETETGGSLKARTLVLATGAAWRLMNVPGEAEYRNKGVSFCPHCDGPLFKGKRVAVVGGGNSGIEAAIDLAGVVEHVTVLEFLDELKADAVLVSKLRSLPNVDVIVNAATTEVVGDGAKVTGLKYSDRTTSEIHEVALDGVFVQIGLVPSTQWLDGVVERNGRGEIITDDRGATNVPGIYAAGDCTDAPYKQIVIAYGSGATAALGAFDYLIRTPAAE